VAQLEAVLKVAMEEKEKTLAPGDQTPQPGMCLLGLRNALAMLVVAPLLKCATHVVLCYGHVSTCLNLHVALVAYLGVLPCSC